MNTAICDAPFPIQETSNTHHFPHAPGAVAGAGQASPAEGTLALGQFSPLEGAFMGTQQHTPRAEPEPELPVQSTSNDLGMTSVFVLQTRAIQNLSRSAMKSCLVMVSLWLYVSVFRL